jgi:polysaccharide biosynthesis protein VpsQ
VFRAIVAAGLSFLLFILWIIYQANTGGSSLFFDFVRTIPHGDKFGHAGLFGTLTLLAVLGTRFRIFRVGKLRIYIGAAAVTIFVIGEEASQYFIPSRTFDLGDLAADFVGIALATLVASVLRKYLPKTMKERSIGAAP